MFVLELINKDCEGTWGNNICVSEDKDKLKERAITERAKIIANVSFEPDSQHLFKIGDLEIFINSIIEQARQNMVGDDYYMDGEKIGNYQDLKTYLDTQSQPLIKSLGLEERDAKDVLKNGFYSSLKFIIREIEII